MEHRPYSKEALKKIIKRFAADKRRGISIEHFAEIAGVDHRDFRKAFLEDKLNISEAMQIRVSRAYKAYERGDIVVWQNWDRTRTVDYRDKPKPVFRKNLGIMLTRDGVKLNIGLINRGDYTQPTLLEQFDLKIGG